MSSRSRACSLFALILSFMSAGTMLGSGGIVVLDETVSMVEFALRTISFYQHESCGWCIPCRELEAPLAELAAKFAGRARVVRVNVEWSSRVAQRYEVQALPTILVFKGGVLVSRSTGGASEQDLEELLTEPPAAATVATTPIGAPAAAETVATSGR